MKLYFVITIAAILLSSCAQTKNDKARTVDSTMITAPSATYNDNNAENTASKMISPVVW